MKKLATTLMIASLSLLTAAPVFADYGDRGHGKSDRITQRLDRQQRRIAQGIKADQLTRQEVRVLRQDHKDIRQLVRLFRDDGRLSKGERRYLHKRLDNSSQQIKRLKQNDINRYVRLHERYGKRDLAQKL